MEKKEEIISNKIKCKKCGDIIESKSTNDYKRCSCGAVAVDGGKDYLKRIGTEEQYEELSIIKNTSQSYCLCKIINSIYSRLSFLLPFGFDTGVLPLLSCLM